VTRPDSAPPSDGRLADQSAKTARVVMSSGDVSRALRRVAHEILERNKGSHDLVLLGIPTRGVSLALRPRPSPPQVEGREVPCGALDITMHRDDLRRQPIREIEHTTIPAPGIDDKTVVLVDDVLFSGRTVRAAMDALSDLGRPRAVRLAVLVDRGHRDLPIRADYVGKNLPTSSSERVQVCVAEYDGLDEVRISGGER
jgi:pyrimidine operon attenuation protein/uracil phosphoribosyltransferase